MAFGRLIWIFLNIKNNRQLYIQKIANSNAERTELKSLKGLYMIGDLSKE